MREMEFWFEYASTYTYLSIARIGRLADQAGVHLHWQPFLLQPVMAAFGMQRGPFQPFPDKQRYMWRDIERRANDHQIRYRKPSTYPPNSLLTARVGVLAASEGWCRAFSEQVFHWHWTQDVPIGSEENLAQSLESIGQIPEAVLARANLPENKDKLRVQTKRAQSLGLFGSPSFVVGGELFWGDDRLEAALRWAQAQPLKRLG